MKFLKKSLVLACSACLLSISTLTLAQEKLTVLEVEGELQRALSPSELIKIETQGELTMRALRAFNLLPESFMGLAMDLRRANIDLLAATADEVRALQPQIEEGALKADKDAYNSLLYLLESQAYLEWESLEKGTILSADEPLLVRGEGRIRGQIVNQLHLPVLLLSANELNVGVQEIALAQQASVPEPPEIAKNVTAKLSEWLAPISFAGLRWNFDEDGKVTVEFTGAVLENLFDNMTLHIGDLVVIAEPEKTLGVWSINANLPDTVYLTEGRRTTYNLDSQFMSFGVLWNELEDRYQGVSLAANSMELKDGRERLVFEGLDLFWRESSTDDGKAEGQFSVVASSMGMGPKEGELSHTHGDLSLNLSYHDYDLIGLEEVADWLEVSDLEAIFVEADEKLQGLIRSLGDYHLTFSLKDLNSVSGYGRESVQLAGIDIQLHSGVSEDDAERRDSYSHFQIEGLNYLGFGDGINAERLQFSVSLSGFKPQLFSKLIHFTDLSGETLVDILSEAFNSFEVAAESGVFNVLEKGLPIFTIHGFNSGLQLKDFNKAAAQVSLNYEHSGFSITDLDPVLAPQAVVVYVNLNQIPWRDVLAGIVTKDIGSMLFALKTNETQLNLETVSVSLPDAGLNVTGVGYLDEFDPESGPPVFKAQVLAEAVSLVSWADAMRLHMPEREVADFNQFMAIVMLVADQVEENLHRFNIDINSLGELWVNEKDMSSLFK